MQEFGEKKFSRTEAVALATKIRDEYTVFYNQVAAFYSSDAVIADLMRRREYTSPEMYQVLKEVGVTRVSYLSELDMAIPLSTFETLQYWGLTDRNGNYLLADRFVIPIRDIAGRVTALVGWFPDERKYITTPTFGFSKDAQFFNMETYERHLHLLSADTDYKDNVYLCEGIFDTLSLRSLGLFGLGNMGLGLSPFKREILSRFGHIYAIPDADKAGRGVLPYSGIDSRFKWKLNQQATFVELHIDGVKDVDDLIRDYDCKTDLISLLPIYTEKITEGA